MCLDTVHKEAKQWTEGWKIFIKRKSTGKLEPYWQDFSTVGKKTYPTNRWIKDTKRKQIRTSSGTEYPTGFHFFKHKSAADVIYGDILKVKIRNIVATGSQDSCLVGVAREIFIIKE